jgi:hypothetical protein
MFSRLLLVAGAPVARLFLYLFLRLPGDLPRRSPPPDLLTRKGEGELGLPPPTGGSVAGLLLSLRPGGAILTVNMASDLRRGGTARHSDR